VGKRIAGDTARYLGLSQHQTEMLEFLVHKHLLMSRAALWHDINDPAVMQSFVVEVGSPEVLRMLYVLTAADMAAVGPDVLNDWKIELLTQFYNRAMKYLTGGDTLVSDEGWAKKRREKIAGLFGDSTEATTKLIDSLPVTYLRGTPPEQVVEALRRVQTLGKNDVDAWGQHYPDRGVIEFTVAAHLSLIPGTFYRLAGALASEGVEVLSAQINTLSSGWALDRFHGIDNQYDGLPPEERIEKVCDRLVCALKDPHADVPRFRRIWNKQDVDKATLSGLPTRVLFDNVTSERATILQVFAPDRLGLLYTAAKKIHDLKLGIVAAKIGTYLDQVVDVFYVTDDRGAKILDELRLQSACDTLLETLEQFEAESLAGP
jgi:[protein-PII] uridylyltransferase